MTSIYDRRTPARWLGPLALLAVGAAIVVLASGTLGGGGETGPTPKRTVTVKVKRTTKPVPAYYTVRQGDVLSVIADRFGVSTARLEQLNPTLDPRLLRPGMRLRLR